MTQLELDRGRFNFDRASADEIAVFLAGVAVAAGPAVMEVYEVGGQVRSKSDGSPVTVADERAEAIICAELALSVPPTPIVAEESTSLGKKVAVANQFLLVDPLDGTKEFVAHNGEFTINVALIDEGKPVAGAVYAPASDEYGSADNARSSAMRPSATACPDGAHGGRSTHADL